MSDPSTPIVEAKGLIKEFHVGGGLSASKRFRAVDDVSFQLKRGETVGIVGESGSGKSTTARLIARLLDATEGQVLFDGEDVTHVRGSGLRDLRGRMQFVFQDPYASLNPRQDLQTIITAPLRYQGVKPKGPLRNVAAELLERVGLDPSWGRRLPRQLSGGQAQRVGIARAIAISPSVVICDEAVSALDVSVQAQILRLLKDLQRDFAFSYLFISHDLAVVRQMAHWVCVMQGGRIVEQADRDSIFERPQEAYTRTLLAAVPSPPTDWPIDSRSVRHGAA